MQKLLCLCIILKDDTRLLSNMQGCVITTTAIAGILLLKSGASIP